MKLIILSGNHPRHFYLTKDIIELFRETKVISMKRESLIPKNELSEDKLLNDLVKHHFNLRKKKEDETFGYLNYESFTEFEVNYVTKDELNSEMTKSVVRNFKADIAVICGTYLFDEEFIKILPKYTINIHLGLSPWYRGSATLFWPNYFLEPWKTGVTFHFLNEFADAGEIIYQTSAKLDPSMGVHDAAVANIQNAKIALIKIIKKLLSKKFLLSKPQNFVGKTFLSSDFKPYHLKLIYEYFDDKVIKYLFDKNQFKKVKLINPNNI